MNDLIKIEQNVLSESNLNKIFMKDSRINICNIPQFKVNYITDEDLELIINTWKNNIERESDLLSRQSLSSLTDLPNDSLYSNLDKYDWRTAAQISEIFRNPLICKNAGRLDYKNLQIQIRKWIISSDESLNLSLNWGQPKRTAGRLKSINSYADLAEMFSIARLITIVNTLEKILKSRVNLTINTGGSRFFSALFTRIETIEEYDKQRQIVANTLDDKHRISFIPYFSETNLDFNIDDTILNNITDELVVDKLNTILLNIDWEHLLDPNKLKRFESPHNIVLPYDLDNWLNNQNLDVVLKYIRLAISYLITNKNYADSDDDSIEHMILDHLVSFMHNVSWESSKKYIAIHNSNFNEENGQYLRLTVHEKSSQRTLPAILTLGINGGNQLSQHILALISENELKFGAYAEFWDKELCLIYLEPNSKFKIFNWLVTFNQPFCLSLLHPKKLVSSISKASRLFN